MAMLFCGAPGAAQDAIPAGGDGSCTPDATVLVSKLGFSI